MSISPQLVPGLIRPMYNIIILYWNVPYGDTSSGTLIAVCVSVCVCMRACVRAYVSADISLYCAKNDYPEIWWVCWVSRCHECIQFWLRTN